MHKSTRYGYSIQTSYFERFFTVRSTTRTTDFPDIDHRQKKTQNSQPPKGYYEIFFSNCVHTCLHADTVTLAFVNKLYAHRRPVHHAGHGPVLYPELPMHELTALWAARPLAAPGPRVTAVTRARRRRRRGKSSEQSPMLKDRKQIHREYNNILQSTQ
jgi:hypothetical protein